MDIAFNLEINEFMNMRTVQFNVKDIRLCERSLNEQKNGEIDYEKIKNGEYTGNVNDVVPTREDFALVYNFLSREARDGVHEYSYIRLLNAIRGRKKDHTLKYAKLKNIIKIFRELNIVLIEEKDELSFEFRIVYTKTKTNLEKSNILKKLKTLYIGK